MANHDDNQSQNALVQITERDIVFECAACHKSLVVDESAEGATIECPQCHISVIVRFCKAENVSFFNSRV